MSADLQVKGIPKELKTRLAVSAERNFRSINQEAMARIEMSFDLEDALVSKTQQKWIDEALAGEFRPGSLDRLRDLAAKAKSQGARMKLSFSSLFETDFASGVEYLAREANEEIATRWEKSVCHTIELLQKNPQLGRLRRDLRPGDVRTFGVKDFPRFLIFYTARENELVLLRVKHGAMNLHALFLT